MFAVCCLLYGDGCSLLLFVVCCLFLLCAVRCSLLAVGCSLFVVCCLMVPFCWLVSDVRRCRLLLLAAWCLLLGVS